MQEKIADADLYLMALAILEAQNSHLTATRKTGAVAVGADGSFKLRTHNGFPDGVNRDLLERNRKDNGEVYHWVSHAERRLVSSAAREGVALKNCCVYASLFPCSGCATAMSDSGVKEIVSFKPDFNDPKWGEDFKRSQEIFKESGMKVRYLPEFRWSMDELRDIVSEITALKAQSAPSPVRKPRPS